jgi:hypothetical protein
MIKEPAATPPAPSRRALVTATAIALLVAGIILVVAVLPAEYGIDPLGTGRALGLTNLYGAADENIVPTAGSPVVPHTLEYRVDTREFTLGPYDSFEFKYELAKGASMVYAWTASADLEFDFHTEPAGKPPEASDSFEKGNAAQSRGAYSAPYDGIHGWYWENTSEENVTIKLAASGFYSSAKMFTGGGNVEAFEIPPALTRVPRP